ncbi:MAG TPA: VacJ family lipoprotein [Nitrospiraceae bacterium]|nr:VacJ family lipoprotein [Nitrospiraceae bacterium]
MEGWSRAVICRLLIVSAAGMLMGCVEWSETLSGSMTLAPSSSLSLRTSSIDQRDSVMGGPSPLAADSASDAEERHVEAEAASAPVIAAETARTRSKQPPAHGTQEERAVDSELYDPFQKPGEQPADVEEYDPWEPFNVAIFNFNRKVDKYLVKPVAQGYDFLVPDEIERGIRRVFHNIRFAPRLLNNLFQGKFKGAGLELGRFLINSTLGLGGYLDFAKEVFYMDTPDEDFGQTLGKYGVKPGRYLVLPIPPFVTTVRDLVGYIGDIILDPVNYFLIPSIQLNAPAAIGHSERATIAGAQYGSRTVDVINERSINLDSFEGLEEATVDLYATVRNAYLQKRAQSIRE